MDNTKYDLKDVTFLLSIKIDTIERLENILAVTEFLTSNFNTNIKVCEIASYNNEVLQKLLDKQIAYTFFEDDDPILHRTKYLNLMTKTIKTPYVAVWDVDVLIPIKQILDTVSFLRQGIAEVVYPYIDNFLDTGFILRKLYLKKRQIEFLERNKDKMTKLYLPNPVGGAFFCKLEAYMDIGLENEGFYGWGIEDGERFHRWKTSKYNMKRLQGVLFHLSHSREINSKFHHNDQSFIKLRLLNTSIKKRGLLNI